MNINEEVIKDLLSSLNDYNATANQFSTKISSALNIVALTMLGILIYIEIANTSKKLANEHGLLSIDLIVSICWKYFVALAFVLLSDKIIDSFIWLSSAIGHLINGIPLETTEASSTVPTIPDSLSWTQKLALAPIYTFTNFAMWTAEIAAKILIFLRFLMLYIYKAVAGVMFASMASEEWSSIAKSYLRQLLALVIQGFLILLLFKVFGAIAMDQVMTITAGEGDFLKTLGEQFLFLVKSIAFVSALFGTQRLAQKMVGG